MVSDVKSMDHAFNIIHGEGASLNHKMRKDPIPRTAVEIHKKCPDINQNVIEFFTKVKYYSRVRALNEQNKIEVISTRKKKAIEKNERLKHPKNMRDYMKDGHFNNI